MRTAHILARFHTQPGWHLLLEPTDPAEANLAFKRIVAAPEEVAEVQLWAHGTGVSKRKQFAAPAQRNSSINEIAAGSAETHDNAEPAAPSEEAPASTTGSPLITGEPVEDEGEDGPRLKARRK